MTLELALLEQIFAAFRDKLHRFASVRGCDFHHRTTLCAIPANSKPVQTWQKQSPARGRGGERPTKGRLFLSLLWWCSICQPGSQRWIPGNPNSNPSHWWVAVDRSRLAKMCSIWTVPMRQEDTNKTRLVTKKVVEQFSRVRSPSPTARICPLVSNLTV